VALCGPKGVTKVSQQPAHSIFISTLKMEAALFSDTSLIY